MTELHAALAPRDPKHGRFFEHQPASARARVTIARGGSHASVAIDDVISPSILERLAGEDGILAPQIDELRSMVDSVAIGAAYDGMVFDADLIDVPERKLDLVSGTYDMEIPAGSALPVAVRIRDMLGEENLIVESRA
jgi:hypothetical protein